MEVVKDSNTYLNKNVSNLQNMAHTLENKELVDNYNGLEKNSYEIPIANEQSCLSDQDIQKIIHIDDKIGSDEINIPLRKELTQNSCNNNINFEHNNINCMLHYDFNNINTVTFNLDSKDSLNKDIEQFKKDENYNIDINTTSNTFNDTMSCIEEFNEVFKKYEKNNNNVLNDSTLVPSLSETEELLKSVTENKNESSHSNITIPLITTTKNNTIISDEEIVQNPIKHIDHNYVMAISRENSTQLSPNTNEDNNIHARDITPEPSNSKDEVEFEINGIINDCNCSYDIVNKEDYKIDDKSIISISSDSIEYDSEPLSDLNLIDHLDVNIDIISVSSTEIDKISDNNDSDYCEGYHSSDFEFIDENEAKLGGIIKASKSKVSFKNDVVNKKFNTSPSDRRYNFPNGHISKYVPYKINFNDNLQTEFPYLLKNFDKPKTKNELVKHFDESEDFGNHIIPENEDFFDLFAQPWTVYQYEAENKAFYSSKTMHVEVDDIGFNVGALQRRHEEIKVDDVFDKEAEENARKIISMYPFENKKRRRRFR